MSDKTLTIDGISYPLAEFSVVLHEMIAVHESATADQRAAQLALYKANSTIEFVSATIKAQVEKELHEKAETNLKEQP